MDRATTRLTRREFVAAAIGASVPMTMSCSSYPAASGRQEVRQFVERFLEAVNNADTDAFVSFFADDATAFLPTNALRKSRPTQIREAVAPVFAQGPRANRARANDLQIEIRGTTAIASFDAGSGMQHARRTLVLDRVHGEWKIVHLHASNVAETP